MPSQLHQGTMAVVEAEQKIFCYLKKSFAKPGFNPILHGGLGGGGKWSH